MQPSTAKPPIHLPRWQVFARLWGRLGRKAPPVEQEDEVANDAAPDEEATAAEVEAPEGIAKTPEPVETMPDPVEEGPEPEAETRAAVEPRLDHHALLVGALDSLGQAHHRPFSRT